MFASAHKTAASSLDALRRRVTRPALAALQSIVLLQMLSGASQAMTSRVSRSQALARTLLLSGQQRLRDLLAAAPRFHLPVERLLEIVHSGGAKPSPEEIAAQALLEMCLGWMLQALARNSRRPRITKASSERRHILLPHFSAFRFSHPFPLKARLCIPILLV